MRQGQGSRGLTAAAYAAVPDRRGGQGERVTWGAQGGLAGCTAEALDCLPAEVLLRLAGQSGARAAASKPVLRGWLCTACSSFSGTYRALKAASPEMLTMSVSALKFALQPLAQHLAHACEPCTCLCTLLFIGTNHIIM